MSRLPLFFLALMGVLVFQSCSTGSTPSSPNPDPGSVEANPQDPSQQTAALFPVRMRPQKPVVAPVKGVRWVAPDKLPAPELARITSSTDPLALGGSDYESDLPYNEVAQAIPPYAVFTPHTSDSSGDLAGTAYAIYRFEHLADLELPADTVSLAWGVPPRSLEDVYIGLGNRDAGAWDWFQLHSDGVVSLPTAEQYISDSGELLLTVCVLGDAACMLSEIRLGEPELRGMGGEFAPPAGTVNPPLYSGSLPVGFDLSQGCAPIGDQGSTGASTAFAMANGAYNYELGLIYGTLGWDLGQSEFRVSPRYLYIETGQDQRLGCPFAGRYTEQVAHWLMDNGVATEANAPFGSPDDPSWCDPDWSEEAIADAALLARERYTMFDTTGPEGLRGLKAVLVQQQRPVVVQMAVDRQFLEYGPGEVWNFNGPVIGCQVMLVTGYSDGKQAFRVRNSWSTDWGEEGYVWIGYDTFANARPEQVLWCLTLVDDYDDAVAQHFCGKTLPLAPPRGVHATDGFYGDKIGVSWTQAENATAYRVYRDTRDNPVAEVTGTRWYDYDVKDHLSHTYWVQSLWIYTPSVLSAPDSGFMGPAPIVLSVSPTYGRPGEEITFSAVVEGQGPFTYSWDFGGGATPNTSEEASPQVTLGDEGDYAASLTVSNGLGSDVFEFVLIVDSTIIRITSLTTDKWTHYADGGDVLPAVFTVETDEEPSSIEWSPSVGSVVGEGPVVTYRPPAGTLPQVVTVTCTVLRGPGEDSATLKQYLTANPIYTAGIGGGKAMEITGYPSVLHPVQPYLAFSSLFEGEGHVVIVSKWGIWDAYGRLEMTDFQDYLDQWTDQGMYVTGLNFWDADGGATWLLGNGFTDIDTYIVPKSFAIDWQDYCGVTQHIDSSPANLIVDRDGNIRKYNMGSLTYNAVRRAETELLLRELLGVN